MDTQIKKFGRQEIMVIRSEIQSELDRLKNKFGLTQLSLGTITFNEFSFTAKISATLPEQRIFAETYTAEEAKYFALQNGFPEDILQKKFISNGKHHSIIRIETRNPKYPVIAYCEEDGRKYKFSIQQIKEFLSRVP
jgi:phage pi2 protein 07